MEHTMEEKITVVKVECNSNQYFCLKCQETLEYEWVFCPKCGIKLNGGIDT